MLALQKSVQDLQVAAASGDENAARAAFQRMADEVATVLAMRQPDAAQNLSLGFRECGTLAGAIIVAVTPGEENPGPNAPAATGKRRQRRRP